jgi:hypothetical protein
MCKEDRSRPELCWIALRLAAFTNVKGGFENVGHFSHPEFGFDVELSHGGSRRCDYETAFRQPRELRLLIGDQDVDLRGDRALLRR